MYAQPQLYSSILFTHKTQTCNAVNNIHNTHFRSHTDHKLDIPEGHHSLPLCATQCIIADEAQF